MLDFPKPPEDSGVGAHDSASVYWEPHGQHDQYAQMLKEHGITWYLLFVADPNKTDYCYALKSHGIEPIVRIWPQYALTPVEMSTVEAYIQAGAFWFQLGNEYNLNEEWQDGNRPQDGPERTARWYVKNAQYIRDRGGWPMTPPPALGGHVLHRVWFTRFMAEMAKEAQKLGITVKDALYPGGIGLHCRTAGNPLYDGPEDYDCSAREWEWFDGVVKDYVGESLPMANTEAFDEPPWHKRCSPWLSPQEKWEWWRSRNLEQMRWFDPNNEAYRYPLQVICNCFWLIHDGGTWDDCGLLENQTYEREMGISRITKLWEDMKYTITWVRGESTEPPPPPPPQPVKLRVYDLEGQEQTYEWAVQKYGVLLEQVTGAAYHCSQMRERSGPSSIDIYVYNADGSTAVGIPVTFHWPDGSETKNTEVDGKAGFAYGPGSYIHDQSVGGPHWITIEGAHDLVSRLGMLAGTVHDHLDLVYKYGVLETEPVQPEDIIMELAEEKLEALPVPSDWALPSEAITAGYEYQVGGYGRTEIEGEIWIYQTFTNTDQSEYVVAFCKDGDWQNVQIKEVVRD